MPQERLPKQVLTAKVKREKPVKQPRTDVVMTTLKKLEEIAWDFAQAKW